MKNLARFLTLLALFFYGNVMGQTSAPNHIGVQPSVTIEPFYEEGELDVNVFPFILEMPLGQRINLRLLPTVNYHFGGLKNGFSDIGLYTVLPIFIKERKTSEILPYGFYVGPVLGFGRNYINNHYTTTMALEPGYMFETKKSFTITMGLQIGASHFAHDTKPNQWVFHWGPKVTFGFWLKGTE